MNLISRVSVILLSAAFAVLPANAADGFATLSYPLEVNVEGEDVPTAIHLKFEMRRYDVSFDSLAARQLDPREKAFVRWVKALRERDLATVKSMYVSPRPVLPPVETSMEDSRITMAERSPKNVIETYHAAFGGLRDLTVIGQVLAGDKSLFLWEARGAQSNLRRAFSVDEKLGVSEVTMSNPVELLIVNNVVDRGKPGHDAPFEYAFPLSGPWNPGAHPVLIQFSGKPVEIPFYGAEPAAADPVAALYRRAYGALQERDVDRYLQHLTPKSRAKWQRWYRSLPPEVFAQYREHFTAPRAIKFILDASPLTIVFHGEPGNWTAGTLRYDYIVRDGGELKFANVSYAGFFDDVIGSPTLFDQNILRRAAVAAVKER